MRRFGAVARSGGCALLQRARALTVGRRRWLLAIVIVVGALSFWLWLPEPLFEAPYSSILLDRNGRLLGAETASDGQWRFPLMRGQATDKFERALIAFEDKRFYRHPGVDPLAMARAVELNLARGKVVSGGSTLTMQVIRLVHGNPKRTLLEKLIEMALALRLELRYGKREILSLYAGHAPFGGNVIGLDAAAWRYFGRSADKLSWAEACTLAVLPNSPALIHPGKNRGLLKAKRDRPLRAMARAGSLTALDLELALAEPLPDEPVAPLQKAPHLLSTLRWQRGNAGARFDSMLDATLQAAVEEIVERQSRELGRQGISNAAALVVDNETFEVLAYVGNSRWSTQE